MNENPPTAPGRAIGVGGVFFKSADRERLKAWYEANLGIAAGEYGFNFPQQTGDKTVWCVFAADSGYFGPNERQFMVNYIVDDMDALLAKIAANGDTPEPKCEDSDYGRFAWIYDPDGNKIELWQPVRKSA